METGASISSKPRTVEEVFRDYKGRRTAIVRALTTEVDRFYSLCDPGQDNLCLYGYPTESWEVKLPVEELPPDLPEPVLGINFARDSMQRKDWLSMVAVHSDAWLIAVAFFYGALFNRNERKLLFSMINDLPTVFEVVIEREKDNGKSNSGNSGSKTKTSGKRMNDGRLKNPKLTSMVEEEKTYKDDNDENCNTICEICEKIYYPGEFWIACDTCDKWFHGKCVKISKAKSKKIGLYKCPLCNRKNNVHH